MTTSVLEQVFELPIEGIELPGPTRLGVPSQGVLAELRPGIPIRLWTEVQGACEQVAEARSWALVQLLYQRLLLAFAEHVETAAPPRLLTCKFASGDTATATETAALGINAASAMQMRATVVVAQTAVAELARSVELRAVTPQPPTSADLYIAIDMFTAGLEATNSVVRFLIFYSALALAALFKWHNGRQPKVDQLILAVNPSISCPTSHSGQRETFYTKLRNDFIHAEERGKNPPQAIRAIEANLSSFQTDVATVVRSL